MAIFIIFVFLNKKESECIMNIGRITTSNVYKKANEVKAKKQNTVNTQQSATSSKVDGASINEILGRTQVSFTGRNTIRQNFYEHDCNEPFGVRENIRYNKEDGSYVHTVTNRNGTLKSKEEFYPLEQKEIITRVFKDGTEVTENIGTESSKIKRTDKEGREVFLQTKDFEGNLKTVETNYARGRKVIKEEHENKSSIKIIDTKTGQEVTKGPLVYNEEYDKKTDRYNHKNLLTGIIEKSIQYGPKKEIALEEFFSPLTGTLTERKQYNPYIDETFNDDGIREFKTTLSDDKRIKHVYQYSIDGKTEAQHVRYIFDENNQVVEKRNYVPGTNMLSEKIRYAEDGTKKVTIYKENEKDNIALEASTYDENEELIMKEIYHKDGKHIRRRLYETEDHFAVLESFSENGIKLESSVFAENGKLYRNEIYNKVTGNLKSLTERKDSQSYIITSFDDDGKTPVRTATYSDDDKLKDITTFYEDGVTPKSKRTYNNDKLKDITTFYEDGVTPKNKRIYNDDNTYKEIKFDRDGNVINDKKSEKSKQADSTQKTTAEEDVKAAETSTEPEDSDLEFLENIAQIISRQDYNVPTDQDWDRLAVILDVDAKENLFPIDKSTYRELAKKYHPDKQYSENPDDKRRETIFSILNNLHHFEMH